MSIKRFYVIFFIMCLTFVSTVWAQEQNQDPTASKIKWQRGPCVGDLGEAEIHVPGGFVFADASDTKILMQKLHNPVTDAMKGFIAPESLKWFVVFQFSDVGYIKDDEKSSLNGDVMLESMKKGNELSNQKRKENGWEPLNLVGWQLAPKYDQETHNLEWATKFESKGLITINWNTRLLGRNGVMSTILVVTHDSVDEVIPQYRGLLTGFSYKDGNKYSDFKQGDKIAEYGLSALVAGGVLAVAAKTGLFAYLYKFLIFIGIAIAARYKQILAKFTKKKE